jgi:ABC-type transporter Mla subunit MlaD
MVMYIGVGVGVFLVGLSALIVAIRLAGVIHRTNGTVDEVNKQLANLSAPVADTLSHVGGIADTADSTIARLGGVVGQLETVAGSVGKTASLAQDALAPSIVNLGSALTGVTAGIRRLARGKEPGQHTNHHATHAYNGDATQAPASGSHEEMREEANGRLE